MKELSQFYEADTPKPKRGAAKQASPPSIRTQKQGEIARPNNGSKTAASTVERDSSAMSPRMKKPPLSCRAKTHARTIRRKTSEGTCSGSILPNHNCCSRRAQNPGSSHDKQAPPPSKQPAKVTKRSSSTPVASWGTHGLPGTQVNPNSNNNNNACSRRIHRLQRNVTVPLYVGEQRPALHSVDSWGLCKSCKAALERPDNIKFSWTESGSSPVESSAGVRSHSPGYMATVTITVQLAEYSSGSFFALFINIACQSLMHGNFPSLAIFSVTWKIILIVV